MTTLEQLQTQLDVVNKAINDLLLGGAEYMINTGPGGSNRMFKSATLPELEQHKTNIESRIRSLNKTRATSIGAHW